MVRYYGLYAHLKDLPPLPTKESPAPPERLTWRELQIEKTGEDPLICPTCRCELVFVQMAFPGLRPLSAASIHTLPLAYADTS